MSTLKVNEVRHLSNSGTANIVLESNATTNLQATSTLGLTVTGTLTTSGVATFNGNVQIGNATTDTLTLTSKVSGNNNYSGFTGEIRMYAGNAAGDDPPDGWLYCNGDEISETSANGGDHYNLDGKGNDYQTLFNLLDASSDWGNTGSASWGTNKVKVPDFRSRAPVGIHTGAANSITAGLTARALGDTAGTETHTLTTAELAAHSHASTIVASTTGQTASHNITANQSSHTHTGTTNSTTPGATGSTTPGAGGSTTPSATGSTTPSATGSTTPGAGGTQSANHDHQFNIHADWSSGTYGVGFTYGGGPSATTTTINSGSHTHTGAAHTHTSAAHTHTSAAHTHTGAAHTHTSAAHTHAFTTGATDPAITISGSVSLSGTTHTHTLTAVSTGSGTAHTNLSPIIAVNYIIKV